MTRWKSAASQYTIYYFLKQYARVSSIRAVQADS